MAVGQRRCARGSADPPTCARKSARPHAFGLPRDVSFTRDGFRRRARATRRGCAGACGTGGAGGRISRIGSGERCARTTRRAAKCWDYFPHDHARSRAYRWGEDGLLGICDRECRMCFGIALWNGKDPILKERLFGLTGPEGNHGEDVKEPTTTSTRRRRTRTCKALYKYPQSEFPYGHLVDENRRRTKAISSTTSRTPACSSTATGTCSSSTRRPRPTTS